MKKHFIIHIFLVVVLFSEACYACFQENSVNERIIPTFSTFYEECCCTSPGYTATNLVWLGPNNEVIGPVIDSNMYIEEQGDCLGLHIPSTSKTMSGAYKCVTTYDGKEYVETHNLDVYDPVYFFNTTAVQYLVQGQDSMIHCDAKSRSTPLFKWTRGNDGLNEITNSLKYQIVPGGLIVINVTNDDDGIYKCSASVMSTGEELEIDIEVQVMTIPTIKRLTASPENITIAGESLVIECLAEGLPDPSYTWRKLVDAKSDGEPKNITWIEDYNKIGFNSIEPEDAGSYECSAQNFVGQASQIIEITVLVPPTIVYFSNRTVVDGTDIIVLCNATGNPTPNITITYEGKSFEEEKSSIYEQYINNYSVLNVDRSREGIYMCNATNEVLRKPRFDDKNQVVWGWNGELVNLKCEPDANPPANISWRYQKSKDEMDIIDEADVNEILANEVSNSQNYTITITKDFAPYGVFKCIAKNELGEEIQNIHLKQGYVPSIIIVNVTIEQNTTTATSVTFRFNTDNIISANDGPPILGVIGEYDTVENYNVTNIHRNRTWAIGRPFKMENLKPNTTYYIRFAAINRVGTGRWGQLLEFQTLEKSAPEPPIWQVDPLRFSPSNVLKWKEPEDNGEPIDYYALRYCPVFDEIDESQCKEHFITAATYHQLRDLKYNTTYYMELIAHNAEGNSTPAMITLNTIIVADETLESAPFMSGGVIIGISVIIVVVCMVLLDLLLLFWRRQGIIATCCLKKTKKKPSPLNSRDKKGLLRDNGENTDDNFRRHNNGHREYEYNKTTGIITGKHSSV